MKYALLLILTIVLSCKQTKQSTLSDYQPRYEEIDFGTGGGFSGIENFHRINTKGEVYKCQTDRSHILLGENKAINWMEIDKDIEMLLSLWTGPSYSSGQIYYFISFRKDQKAETITWATPENEVDQVAQKLFNKLSKIKMIDPEYPTN
jgi:hypothetical protein